MRGPSPETYVLPELGRAAWLAELCPAPSLLPGTLPQDSKSGCLTEDVGQR